MPPTTDVAQIGFTPLAISRLPSLVVPRAVVISVISRLACSSLPLPSSLSLPLYPPFFLFVPFPCNPRFPSREYLHTLSSAPRQPRTNPRDFHSWGYPQVYPPRVPRFTQGRDASTLSTSLSLFSLFFPFNYFSPRYPSFPRMFVLSSLSCSVLSLSLPFSISLCLHLLLGTFKVRPFNHPATTLV